MLQRHHSQKLWRFKFNRSTVLLVLLSCSAFYRFFTATDEETGWPITLAHVGEFFSPAASIDIPPLDLQALHTYGGLSPESIEQLPRILLTVVWGGSAFRHYMPRFFESVGNQAANNVELLFITLGPNCLDVGDKIPVWANGAKNIHFVCLDEDEYWKMHADVLCERWKSKHDSCDRHTSPLYQRIFSKVIEDKKHDYLHSLYRILRPTILRKFMGDYGGIEGDGPDWWGWCDADTILGNFRYTFPYDIADQFDAIIPTHPNDDEHRLVFMRGHMAFFRNSRRTEKLMWDFPALESIETWETTYPLLDGPPEEAHLSAYLCQNPDIDMMMIDSLLMGRPTAYAESGVFTYNAKASDAAREIIFRQDGGAQIDLYHPTFTQHGKTYPTKLETLPGPGYLPLWFDWHYATIYRPHQWSKEEDGDRLLRTFRRILIRKNGTTVERLEPAVTVGDYIDEEGRQVSVGLRMWLYDHHQEEKRLPNYKALPSLVLHDDTMMVSELRGPESWLSLVKPDGQVIVSVNMDPIDSGIQ